MVNPRVWREDKLIDQLIQHVSEMLRLAPAIVLARSGMVLIIIVDTVMLGRFNAYELGYMAIGLSLVQPLVVTSLGLIMGTLVLSAHSFGAGDYFECGRVWRRSLVYSFWLGVTAVGICFFGEIILITAGQTTELATKGGKIVFLLGLGVPGHLLFLSCSFFLEGIRRPIPGLVFMIIANIINGCLNGLLISGELSRFPNGAEGAAIASTAARWFLALGMVAYVLVMRDGHKFAVLKRARGGWRAWQNQRRLGYATGVSLFTESGAFSAVQQFAGWLGPLPLAAFAASFNLLVLSFMVAIGLGAATAVRVGNAHGRKDPTDMVIAGWTGLILTVLMTTIMGITMILMDEFLIRLFTTDYRVEALAVPLVFWVALVLVSDGGQAVMANALRGRQDVWIPCILQTVAFFGVMIPVTWYLMFPMGQGAAGMFQGVGIATVFSMGLLSYRFHELCRKDQKPSRIKL
ncbi:MAG: hypothetical protein CBB68_08055 [Rhodospirillaceae bacterium TMED8]|nr:MATE family efflux transporter [Magnetovibrio sp.]OUT50929.1 MAG: hypothetical protein CBB68_08055 [Rhodospirillaceae bacterium TMED8]|tara:strand:+ start:4367 stop:5752 length:1386 start_codon:yes stop_codon:yes gene_type:complete